MSSVPARRRAVHDMATASVFEVRYTFANSEVPMIRLVSAVSVLLAAGAASVTFAQLPKFDTAPGKWSYNTRTEIPGMGSIPMSFEQCVTQKDIDEGRNLNSQKEAGMDCKYQDVKVTGNRYQFTAVCTGKNLPEPMVMSYDMTANPNQFDAKMTMTGGNAKAMGGKMNMSMSAKRLGGC